MKRPENIPDREGTIACGGCGKTLTLTTKGVVMEPMRRLIEQQLDGQFPVYCADCEKKEVAREEDERLRAKMGERIERSGIPPRWLEAGFFENLDPEESGEPGWSAERRTAATRTRKAAIAACERWPHELRGVVLTGPVGIGKTMMAGAAARGALARGHLNWLSLADLTTRLRMPFASEEYQAAGRALGSRSRMPLVLDDIDKVKPTELVRQQLYVLVNGAYDRGQPLLVTANRSMDDLATFLGGEEGDAIVSRLAEHCEVFALDGRDRRLDK